MPMRGHGFGVPPFPGADSLGREQATKPVTVTPSFLDEDDDSDYWFLYELLVSPHPLRTEVGSDRLRPEAIRMVDRRDRSWFFLDLTTMQVTQGGPRLLWDAAEALHREWCRLGRPDRDRFGLTVSQDGRHEVWLDDPAAAPCWAFTPTRSCR